ncbi:MAG: hypothetical protein ACYTDW_01750 [Planctomycetota bacterium]
MAENRTDEHKSPGINRKSTSKVFEERVRVETTGNMYHPNLLLFNAALGLGLTQQSLSSDIVSERTDATLNDYDIMARMLQKKSYPVTFYTKKSQNLIARQFLGSMKGDTESSGVSLGLGLKEWPMRFQYSTTESSQNALASVAKDFFNRKDKRFRYFLSHNFSSLSRLSFEVERNEISQRNVSFSSDVKDQYYIMRHSLIFGNDEQHRLSSFLRYYDRSDPFDLTTLQWNEDVRLQHSSTLLTNYKFSLANRERGAFGSQSEFKDQTIRGRVGFEHRLYESLITTGGIFASESEFGSGDKVKPTQKGGNLALSYRKKNPWGRLISSYSISSLRYDQSGGSGTGFAIDEPHVVPTGAATIVELDRVNIDITSITVKDGNGVPFQGEDYTISEINGRVMLNLQTIGTVVPPNFSPGQEFFVDYSFFIEPERKEDILRQNFTVKEQFNNGLSLYYRHSRQDETVKSTLTEIIPDEHRNDTFGIDYINKGLMIKAEQSKMDSTYISSTGKRLQASYSWKINPDTRATLRAFNHWLDFGEPDPRDVSLFSSGGEIFSRLSDRLNISTRLDYRDEDDTRFGITRGFQVRSELEYNYRQLRINAGVEWNFLKQGGVEFDSNFFYIRLKRLF